MAKNKEYTVGTEDINQWLDLTTTAELLGYDKREAFDIALRRGKYEGVLSPRKQCTDCGASKILFHKQQVQDYLDAVADGTEQSRVKVQG